METLGNAKEIWRFRDVLAALGSATLVKPGCEFETLLPQIWKTQEKSCPIGEGLGTPHTTAPPSHKAQTRNLKNVLVVNAHSGVDKGLRVKSCPERWRAWGRGWPRERTGRPGSRRPLPTLHAASRTGQVPRDAPGGLGPADTEVDCGEARSPPWPGQFQPVPPLRLRTRRLTLIISRFLRSHQPLSMTPTTSAFHGTAETAADKNNH